MFYISIFIFIVILFIFRNRIKSIKKYNQYIKSIYKKELNNKNKKDIITEPFIYLCTNCNIYSYNKIDSCEYCKSKNIVFCCVNTTYIKNGDLDFYFYDIEEVIN